MKNGMEQDAGNNDSGLLLEESPPTETEARLVPPPITPVTREMLAERGPRREGWIAALVYAVCVMSLGYPAIAGKFLAGPNSDQFVAGYAFREFG
ncbi:MAG: hypothetical protein ABI556_10705, partial [Gemmatimonadales bacterium]